MILTQDSIDQFLNWLSENGYSPHTCKAYKADLMEMESRLNPKVLDEQSASRFLTQGREFWSPKTTQRKATSLKAFAKWKGNPAFLDSYRLPTPAPPEPHPLPEGIPGVLRLIEATRTDRQRALIGLCGLCGLRVHEACGVVALDVTNDPAARSLYVRGKGAKDRRVPISDAAWSAISPAWVNARATELVLGYDTRYARRLITRIGVEAKLARPIASHDLRATFATAAYEKTGDIIAVSRLLGHASVKTTQGYLGRTEAQMRDASEVA